jgi:transposase
VGIKVENLDHLGIVAGIIDEIGLVECINRNVGTHPKEIVSAGEVVKAMILNGLGFVSAPLYLFERFFVGKATEHLIGKGVKPEHLNDDRLARVLDLLYEAGLSQLFMSVALQGAHCYQPNTKRVHLDSSSFHVHGEYELEDAEVDQVAINITHGYSRDHRPDLKQFVLEMICSGDGDMPLYVQISDGNASDKATFASTVKSFRENWSFEEVELFVCDSALYSQESLKLLGDMAWLSRVPASLSEAKQLLYTNRPSWLGADECPSGYRIAVYSSEYAGVSQRWLLIESEARQESDLDKLQQRLRQQQKEAEANWRELAKQAFACEPDAIKAAERFASTLKFCALEQVKVVERAKYAGSGRPKKHSKPVQLCYFLQAQIVPDQAAIAAEQERAGRFILATNVTDAKQLSPKACLSEYKAQQSVERGFRFLKDPLFFTSSVFVKYHHRVAAMAMVMGLCLLVYALGQRKLRIALNQAKATIANQLGKPTDRPTLRWVFQCFQAVHLLHLDGTKQIANLTEERLVILNFLGAPCQKYYLLC